MAFSPIAAFASLFLLFVSGYDSIVVTSVLRILAA